MNDDDAPAVAPMTDAELAALVAAARELLNLGEWSQDGDGIHASGAWWERVRIGHYGPDDNEWDEQMAVEQYVVKAQPAAVLALAARCEAAEAQRDSWRRTLETMTAERDAAKAELLATQQDYSLCFEAALDEQAERAQAAEARAERLAAVVREAADVANGRRARRAEGGPTLGARLDAALAAVYDADGGAVAARLPVGGIRVLPSQPLWDCILEWMETAARADHMCPRCGLNRTYNVCDQCMGDLEALLRARGPRWMAAKPDADGAV